MASLLVFACDRDTPLVAIPRPEVQLVVRFGPMAPGGLDAHAFGIRMSAHRKVIRRGVRTLTARLRLGAHEAVLGVPAPSLAGRVVALEDLWGAPATRRLLDRLSTVRDLVEAATLLDFAIAERLVRTPDRPHRARLAVDAADRLARASVNAVAEDLGMSERHLRRVFREAVGVSPKAFAKLTRFHRALHAAREDGHDSWASIAAAAGYYDQAHLIAEFRGIAGVTPQTLLGELRAFFP